MVSAHLGPAPLAGIPSSVNHNPGSKSMKTLIIGGAGFIGSRLAKVLVARGHRVTVFDNLSPQVHGANAFFSADLQSVARCIHGDIRDRTALAAAVVGQNVIVNYAAETGTGQSMYAVKHYEDVNIGGTALLMDILVNDRSDSLRKLMVASSRAVYGEGLYACSTHGHVYPAARTSQAMLAGRFEPICPKCDAALTVLATPEEAPVAPSSFYGLSKQVQEQITLLFAHTLGVDAFALRYQNVYGPGQSLSNPYTGLLAVFSNLARQGADLDIFEDGLESRDFVYIDDVVEATAACIAPGAHGVHALNVGSAVRTSVLDVARSTLQKLDAKGSIKVSGAFRVGDIRHNMADITKLTALTGFVPSWSFDDGLGEFLRWAQGHVVVESGFSRSLEELAQRGLLRKAVSA
jgi:dTDP-L-rhamnose 4-epimerase